MNHPKHSTVSNGLKILLPLRILLVIAFISLLMLGGSLPEAHAASGILDLTFGTGGKVTTSVGSSNGGALDLAVQPLDGSIVAVGYAANPACCSLAVTRYDSNGNLDFFFGPNRNGRVITDFGVNSAANAVVTGPTFRIVVGGFAGGDFALARYHEDGSLDNSFGNGGKVITDFGSGLDDEITDLILQNDGKIIAVGRSGNNFALARYNTDGTLDSNFGIDGKVTTNFDGGVARANAALLQTDGKILAIGTTSLNAGGDTADVAIARFFNDGTLDDSYGTNGKVTTDFQGFADTGNDAVLQRDGKLVVAAAVSTSAAGPTVFGVARYNSDGRLDENFGDNGKAIANFTSSHGARAVGLQPNGKIIAVGDSLALGSPTFALTRFQQDGTPDVGYGLGGILVTDFGGPSSAYAAAVSQGGKLIVSGAANDPTQFALARYLAEISPFDYDGDGRSDISVFRASEGTWYVDRSREGLYGVQFGLPDDTIGPADFDGDGIADIAVYRPSTGFWYVLNSSDISVSYLSFSTLEIHPGDVPTPADYDGDGKADISVFRASAFEHAWYWQSSNNGLLMGSYGFGATGDKPTLGDFDGDGKADTAVFRPSTGEWYRVNSSNHSIVSMPFGLSTDIPVPADYDGDGKTDIAVYRPSTGIWYILNSSNTMVSYAMFGLATDIPSPGDFDGDGKADISVFRPSEGIWYRTNSSDGSFSAFLFGTNGDKPTQAAFRY